jgi:hypothetical protein
MFLPICFFIAMGQEDWARGKWGLSKCTGSSCGSAVARPPAIELLRSSLGIQPDDALSHAKI